MESINAYPIPAFWTIALSIICLIVALFGLKKVLAQTDFSAEKQSRIFNRTALTISIWLVLISVLAIGGLFVDFQKLPPKLFIPIIVSFLTALFLGFRSATFQKILDKTPPQYLIGFQSFRVFVELILWQLFTISTLPIQMTFEGLNWDILTGLTAPFVAYFCFVQKSWSPKIAVVWNVLGFALLINIVTIAITSTDSPLRLFWNEPANRIVGTFPFMMIPTVYVVLAFAFHVWSLRQLLK